MNADVRRVARTQRSAALVRDTDTTAFTGLLSDLIARIPGAHAAALVDADGESVDYAGDLDPFDVKVAAAHWRIVLGELDQVALFRDARVLVVRGRQRSFIVRSLPDHYAVVIVLRRRAGFAPSPRAFNVFERALQQEAGIGVKHAQPAWTHVDVQRGARGRPEVVRGLDGLTHQLEVLGAVVGLGRRERGYRVRLDTGFETTLVREAGGHWYADESMSASPSPRKK